MTNPFKIKELEMFTIQDCELYLKNYPYGEHSHEVKKRLRGLNNGSIASPAPANSQQRSKANNRSQKSGGLQGEEQTIVDANNESTVLDVVNSVSAHLQKSTNRRQDNKDNATTDPNTANQMSSQGIEKKDSKDNKQQKEKVETHTNTEDRKDIIKMIVFLIVFGVGVIAIIVLITSIGEKLGIKDIRMLIGTIGVICFGIYKILKVISNFLNKD